jgi:hypothetical protein
VLYRGINKIVMAETLDRVTTVVGSTLIAVFMVLRLFVFRVRNQMVCQVGSCLRSLNTGTNSAATTGWQSLPVVVPKKEP